MFEDFNLQWEEQQQFSNLCDSLWIYSFESSTPIYNQKVQHSCSKHTVCHFDCFVSCVPVLIHMFLCVCILETSTCCSTCSKFCCGLSANPKHGQSTHPPTALSPCQPHISLYLYRSRSLSLSPPPTSWPRPCPGLGMVILASLMSFLVWCVFVYVFVSVVVCIILLISSYITIWCKQCTFPANLADCQHIWCSVYFVTIMNLTRATRGI